MYLSGGYMTWAQTVLTYKYMYIPCARPQRVDNMYPSGGYMTWAQTVLTYKYMYIPCARPQRVDNMYPSGDYMTWDHTVLDYKYMYIPCARPQRVDNMYLSGGIHDVGSHSSPTSTRIFHVHAHSELITCTPLVEYMTWDHTALAYKYTYIPCERSQFVRERFLHLTLHITWTDKVLPTGVYV
ncbi:hypothetical protein NDU88_002016 [Pleurodeles waltl]|uniref:Uncharacterized protein n=1 Tax=Pleurodeles waltl TaxID=8319 RepID=A0AAV7Q5I6_PLEWA|nr:hypothetical protein NDU88_002016 [Pleurodeles waltl]